MSSYRAGKENIIVITKGSEKENVSKNAYILTKNALEILYDNISEFKKMVNNISNKNVLIKPNITKTPIKYNPDQMMNTHPQSVQAVVDFLIQNNAKKIIIGESNVWSGGTKKAFRECGYTNTFNNKQYEKTVFLRDLKTKKEKYEDRIYITSDLKKDVYKYDDINYLKKYFYEKSREKISKCNISSFIDEATSRTIGFNKIISKVDLVINISKLKTHVQVGPSLCEKNLFGLQEPPITRHVRHLGLDPLQQDISYRELIISYINLNRTISLISEAFSRLNIPQLCLVEGIIAQEENGPLEHGKDRREDIIFGGWNNSLTLDYTISKDYMQIKTGKTYFVPPYISMSSNEASDLNKLHPDKVILMKDKETIDSSISELVSQRRAFVPPIPFALGCSPMILNNDTLLSILESKEIEFKKKNIDIDTPVSIIKNKAIPESIRSNKII